MMLGSNPSLSLIALTAIPQTYLNLKITLYKDDVSCSGDLPLPSLATYKTVPSMPITIAASPWKKDLERQKIATRVPALS